MNAAGAWVAIALAIIGGGAGFAALVRTFLEKPKIRADTMSLVNQAALSTLQEARTAAAATRQELSDVKKELREAEDRVDELEDREDLYVETMRILARYVKELQTVMVEAGMPVPDHPIPNDQLERLLTRMQKQRRP